MPETAIEKSSLTREQIELIKASVARGATDLELKLFLYQCQRTGLDPLSRQIHFVRRGEQGTIQTGIDGYRVIADRTGECAGIDDAIFDGEGEPSDSPYPKRATVTVYRMVQGQKCAFTATARWSEYFPSNEKQQFFWKKMPYGQLGKCAEALALRKAFPQQLSGVYTHEEMQQAGPEIIQVGSQVVEANTKEASQAVMEEKLKQLKASEDARKQEGLQKASELPPAPVEHVLLEGVLHETSQIKTSKKGSPYITAKIGETEVTVFDHKIFEQVGLFINQRVRANVELKAKGEKTYRNVESLEKIVETEDTEWFDKEVPF